MILYQKGRKKKKGESEAGKEGSRQHSVLKNGNTPALACGIRIYYFVLYV